MSELPNWVQEHIELYRKNPKEGHMWDSSVVGGPGEIPCLLLTTMGRKSGKERVHPLIYSKEDDGYVVIASKGGAPSHPAWFFNLKDNPEVTVQVAEEVMKAQAEVVEGEKRARYWDNMAEIWPPYNDYQEKTDRKIPVVLLKPKS